MIVWMADDHLVKRYTTILAVWFKHLLEGRQPKETRL